MPQPHRRTPAKKQPEKKPRVRQETVVQIVLPNSDGEEYRLLVGPQTLVEAGEYSEGGTKKVEEDKTLVVAPCGDESTFLTEDLKDPVIECSGFNPPSPLGQ